MRSSSAFATSIRRSFHRPGVACLQGSSIHIYDEVGNFIRSLNGFHFSNTSNVVAMHIALHPSHRFGYVDGADPGVTQIQGFTY